VVPDTLKITERMAHYTVESDDDYIRANAISSYLRLRLPAAVALPGKVYIFKKIDDTDNPVLLQPSGDETIAGREVYRLRAPYSTVIVRSDGQNWTVLSSYSGSLGKGLFEPQP
jgi:hypothetical protein